VTAPAGSLYFFDQYTTQIRQKFVCVCVRFAALEPIVILIAQGVEVSSPQPQPIDDIASMRAVPWDDSGPRAVQVVCRHGAIDLMPLLC
jgi:hypothetical protein